MDDRPIRIGISSCLLGNEVRFDGGHKHDGFLTGTLGRFVEWVPVCPEFEAGLGVPRPAMRLERDGGSVRLVAPKTGADHTERLRRFSRSRVRALAGEELTGFVLKKDSPSCGMERVKLYSPNGGMPSKSGRGLFAERLLEAFPNLPVEEEGRLNDPGIRENWIERVFAYRKLRRLWAGQWGIRDLVAFHTSHKLTLLAHSPKAYAELGRRVAGAKRLPRDELRRCYEDEFMKAMAVMATRRRHGNVLRHVVGYFRKDLDTASRDELHGLIEDYERGLVPLIVPITLCRHHVRRLGIDYLAGQTYLNPHPKELALRNHV